jgi:tetratricopeptide (TPR) repeat protein
MLASRGDVSGAVRHLRRALENDPISPSVNADLGWLFFRVGRHRDAVEQCELTLELVPGSIGALTCLVHANQALGRIVDARAHAVKAMRQSGGEAATVATVERGEPADGLRLYFDWRADLLSVDSTASSYARALAFADANRMHAAIGALEDAVHAREHELVFLDRESRFAGLRSRERFRRVLAATAALSSRRSPHADAHPPKESDGRRG